MKLIKKPNFNLKSKIPFLLMLLVLVVGVSMAGFVYFLFNREAEPSVIQKAEEEVSKISIGLNKDKAKELLNPEVEIDLPSGKKSPFASF